ncbi:WhiB family transcriptional regulator [Gordonia shandongensis]|uniref:WhiB family transcriptional regulator n=1 Tax=Gordonia shandongensis TaxID=376351 RepID=UPI000416B1E8|nr:WhiB family transcriptional regulator [Gordonia shandongensis]
MNGNCRGLESSIFFHPEGERGAARMRRERRAKQVCAACPVLEQCRSHALRVDEPYGIWGGLTESERNLLRRRTPHRIAG